MGTPSPYYIQDEEHSITCPKCGAAPGQQCQMPSGKFTFHDARRKELLHKNRRLAAKEFYWRAMRGDQRA